MYAEFVYYLLSYMTTWVLTQLLHILSYLNNFSVKSTVIYYNDHSSILFKNIKSLQ